MRTEDTIAELRREAELRRNDFVPTFTTNISDMCFDVANRLEERTAILVDGGFYRRRAYYLFGEKS